MTTFTTEDREAIEKELELSKQLKEVEASPPHIVNSGASVMPEQKPDDGKGA
jgi:hypothetical protein